MNESVTFSLTSIYISVFWGSGSVAVIPILAFEVRVVYNDLSYFSLRNPCSIVVIPILTWGHDDDFTGQGNVVVISA
jgi:hypothetical protein